MPSKLGLYEATKFNVKIAFNANNYLNITISFSSFLKVSYILKFKFYECKNYMAQCSLSH